MVVSPNPPLELTRGHDACSATPVPTDHHTRSIWGNLRTLLCRFYTDWLEHNKKTRNLTHSELSPLFLKTLNVESHIVHAKARSSLLKLVKGR
jgi:hypothetical protein